MAENNWDKIKRAQLLYAVIVLYTILCCFFHLPLPSKMGFFYLHK